MGLLSQIPPQTHAIILQNKSQIKKKLYSEYNELHIDSKYKCLIIVRYGPIKGKSYKKDTPRERKVESGEVHLGEVWQGWQKEKVKLTTNESVTYSEC